MDESLKLKDDLQKISRQVERREEEAAFATPNGSADPKPVASAPTTWNEDGTLGKFEGADPGRRRF